METPKSKTHFKIGTRKSQLALVQTHEVRDKLIKTFPDGITFDIVEMSTKGDEVLDRALYKIGDKSLFTKALEDALIVGDVDMVVHSLKDLPGILPDGLVIGAVLERETPNDVVVIKNESPNAKTWEQISQTEGSVIGTSSVRRTAQLRGKYPHLKFQDIRGNLNTRLSKLDATDGPYNAIILAAAGIKRLKFDSRISKVLDDEESLNAVSQGALAVECRYNDQRVIRLLERLNHKDTVLSVIAERAFMRRLDGGCSAPLAAHARILEKSLHMTGGVWSLDGKTFIKGELEAEVISKEKSLHMTGSVWHLDEKTPIKETLEVDEEEKIDVASAILVPKCESEYAKARDAGFRLAEIMVAKGAQEILKAAKNEVHKLREN